MLCIFLRYSHNRLWGQNEQSSPRRCFCMALHSKNSHKNPQIACIHYPQVWMGVYESESSLQHSLKWNSSPVLTKPKSTPNPILRLSCLPYKKHKIIYTCLFWSWSHNRVPVPASVRRRGRDNGCRAWVMSPIGLLQGRRAGATSEQICKAATWSSLSTFVWRYRFIALFELITFLQY